MLFNDHRGSRAWEPGFDAMEARRGAQAALGEGEAPRSRDALDQATQARALQIVGHATRLPGGALECQRRRRPCAQQGLWNCSQRAAPSSILPSIPPQKFGELRRRMGSRCREPPRLLGSL